MSYKMHNHKNIVCVTYDPENRVTDFHELIVNGAENTLFLYNENVEQFLNREDVRPGGGNAVIRKFRYDNPSNSRRHMSCGSLGIPTMFLGNRIDDDEVAFDRLLECIHQAFQNIRAFIDYHDTVQNVVWSADGDLCIGLSIAVKAKRISEEQARIIQMTVKDHMRKLIADHSFQIQTYGTSDASLSTIEFLKLLQIQ